MTKATLTSTHDELEQLHEACQTRKQEVRVSREALERLLIDHSVMFNALGGALSVKTPEADSAPKMPADKRKPVSATRVATEAEKRPTARARATVGPTLGGLWGKN